MSENDLQDRAEPFPLLPRSIGAAVSPEEALLNPARLYTAEEVRAKDCPIPATSGVYAWYFTSPPPGVPTDGCHGWSGAVLLYVGISPKAPPKNGRAPSRQTIRDRVRYHYGGNAEGSTLRLTLGCLLADELGISLRRVGSGKRMTFGHEGEAQLTEWMALHARVVWTAVDSPWELEEELIRSLALPLNLDQNRHSPFHQKLSALRAGQKALARSLPIEGS
ncbi:GIY-YIG nuclease family protein [Microbispora rosea]|uniref:GIY-YIG nuclease family protein n=1 Tax=Microbispora rosea TaxID=58117 RepID=UPI0034449977